MRAAGRRGLFLRRILAPLRRREGAELMLKLENVKKACSVCLEAKDYMVKY